MGGLRGNKGGSLDPPLDVIPVVANTLTKSIQKHFVEYDVKSKYPEILDRRQTKVEGEKCSASKS